MSNYETLKMTVITFEQTDVIRTSPNDNIGGEGDWE